MTWNFGLMMMNNWRSRHTTTCWKQRVLARVDDLVHLMLHQKSFGRGIFPLVTGRSKATTLLQILFTTISNSIEGKVGDISNIDYSMSVLHHMTNVFAGIYLSRLKRLLRITISTSKKKCDTTGKEGLSALQKCVASLRILAYGLSLDVVDEYVRIGESTARQALHHFCRAVIAVLLRVLPTGTQHYRCS